MASVVCGPKVECFQKKRKYSFRWDYLGWPTLSQRPALRTSLTAGSGLWSHTPETPQTRKSWHSLSVSLPHWHINVFLKIEQLFFRRAAGPTNLPTRDRNEASHDRGPQCRARPGAQGRKAKSRRTKRLDLILLFIFMVTCVLLRHVNDFAN